MNPYDRKLDESITALKELTADIPGIDSAITRLVRISALYGACEAKQELTKEIHDLKSIIGLQESILQAWKSI